MSAVIDRRVFIGVAATMPFVTPSAQVDVCDGSSAQTACRYLGATDDGKSFCHKNVPNDRKIIDEEVADYLQSGRTIVNVPIPLGDNCPGKTL
jgi:hypothetical protein